MLVHLGLIIILCASKKCSFSNSYPLFGHLFIISKILIAGPHLSGFEFLGHKVTVGNFKFSNGYVIVSTATIDGFAIHTEIYKLIGFGAARVREISVVNLQRIMSWICRRIGPLSI